KTAAARSTWLIHPDKENQDRRLFICLKNNLTREKSGLAFQINDGRIEYEQGTITDLADDIFRDEIDQGPSVQEAIEFIDSIFVDDPTPKAIDVLAKARKAGINEKTLRRAKATLDIKSTQHRSGFWRWEKSEPKSSEKPKDENV
ncbi:unnamed protein product, partial [marine sediment metagenome]